jgi:hypothetical protein
MYQAVSQLAVGDTIDALTRAIDDARDLVPHHGRQRRRVTVETHPGQDLGEVEARGPDSHPHLAGSRFRVRRFPDLEHIRSTSLGDPYLSHCGPPIDSLNHQDTKSTKWSSQVLEYMSRRTEINQGSVPSQGKKGAGKEGGGVTFPA